MPTIIERLLKVRCRFLKQDKSIPKTFRLRGNKIDCLIRETLGHCYPGETQIKVLDMQIIEV